MKNKIPLFTILVLIAIFTIPAFGEKVSLNIVGDNVLQINQTNPLIRADVVVEKYDPQNGGYFMQIIDQSTGEILKDTEIYLRDRQDRVWSTQIAYISSVDIIGEFEILVYSELGDSDASIFFSVVETKDLSSESTPEVTVKEFQDQKDSNELHFTGQIGEIVDCEFIDYKVTGTILPFDELPIIIEIINPEGKIVGSESFTLESSTFQKNIKVDDWSVSGTYLIHLTYKYLIYEEGFVPNIEFPTDKEISDCRFKQSVEEQIEKSEELEVEQTDVEIENLGEEVSKFVHESRDLFKQQREETRAQIKECRESVRNAESSEREELRKQCRADLNEIRDSYKELRHVYHETFKEFRNSMKILIKENRGIAVGENERAAAIEDIENRAQMSDKKEKIRAIYEQMKEEIAEDRKQLREQHNQEREQMREKMKMSRDEVGSEMDSEERKAEREAMKEEREQMREKHDADREQMKAERDAAKAERDAERDAEEEERENEDS